MSPTAAAPQGFPPPPASDAGGTLSFYLNGHRRTLPAGAAKQTILDYLRLDAKLTGTKEGCGEGDCGACTVLLCDRGPDGALQALFPARVDGQAPALKHRPAPVEPAVTA